MIKNDEEKFLGVLDQDTATFFQGIGKTDELKLGELKCEACNIVLTYENFGAAYKDKGKYVFSCDKKECLSQFYVRKQ